MIFQNFWIKPVPGKAPRQQPKDLRLVMWKEGFTIDDEPLRRYDDPANKTWDHNFEKYLKPKFFFYIFHDIFITFE